MAAPMVWGLFAAANELIPGSGSSRPTFIRIRSARVLWESNPFLQLIKYAALQRWPELGATHIFETLCGKEHQWSYRGQVIPLKHKGLRGCRDHPYRKRQ